MSFTWRPRRGPAPVRARGPVYAVGQRVSVTCSAGQPTRVKLTDDAGSRELGSVAEGTEVEILAWRPNGWRGTRYRVRAAGGGVEGWLDVGSLRGSEDVVAPAWVGARSLDDGARVAASEPSVDTGRRFGQR